MGQITLPDFLAKKIADEAKATGCSETMLVTDILTAYFEHTSSNFSYKVFMLELEEELDSLIKQKQVEWEFTLGELETFKTIERVSNNFKPSTIKATVGKMFLQQVNDPEKNRPYTHIRRSKNSDGSLRFRNRAALYKLSPDISGSSEKME